LKNRYAALGLDVNIPAFYDYISSKKVWVRKFGSNDTEYADGISVDSNGNIYVVGYTRGDLNGNINEGNGDAYIVKYGSDGTPLWTSQFGTSEMDRSLDSTAASDGSLYAVGFTGGDLEGNGNLGGSDAFVAKYNLEGVSQWTRQFGTDSTDSARSVAVDPDGNVYAAGSTQGNFDGNVNAGDYDAFVTKYNSDGAGLWSLQFGTSYREEVMDMAVDSSGSIYVVGFTGGDLEGNGNSGDDDAFVVKYDQDGIMQWTRQFGSTAKDWAHALTIDSNGNIYVAGDTGGDLGGNGNAGVNDAFLLKYDSDGTIQWTRQFGTTDADPANGVAVDANDNIYVVGYTNGDLDGYAAVGASDPFIVIYTSEGTLKKVFQFGTLERDRAIAVASDADNNIYVTGYTAEYLGVNSVGDYDAFLVKFLH